MLTPNQEQTARYAKALGHPVRIAILEMLAQQSRCYHGDMSQELPIAKSTLSQHLAELKNAGLIRGEINPPTVRYCINPLRWAEARQLLGQLFRRYDNTETNKKTNCYEPGKR